MPDPTSANRRFLGHCLAGAAAAQAVAAIVFFFAANWWSMGPALKIGLIDAALVAAALSAFVSTPRSFARAVWVVTGIVLTGVLFAVHGQTWQTGADAWELFVPWAGLAALWALTSRLDAAWLVTAIVATIAVFLWLVQRAPLDLIADHWQLSFTALAPLAVAGLRQGSAWLPGAEASPRVRWLIPVLLAGAAVPLGVGGAFWQGESLYPLLAGLGAAGLTMAVARPARCGPWPFAIALILAVVLVEALVLHRLVDEVRGSMDFAIRMLMAAGLLLAGIAGLSIILKSLFRGNGVALAVRMDVLVSAAIGVGAWLAAMAAMAGWAVLMGELAGSDLAGALTAGFGGLIAAALFRKASRPHSFASHVQAAFLILAYGALLFQIAAEWFDEDVAACLAVLLLPALLAVTANAAAGVAGSVIAITMASWRLYDADPLTLALFAMMLAALGYVGLAWQRASVRACAVCLLLAAFLIPGVLEFVAPHLAQTARAAAALSAGGLMAITLYRRPDLRDPRLIGAGGLVLAGSLVVPAGGAGLVGLTAMSVRAVGWPLVAMGFLSAAWAVVRFYYLLDIPLAEKAGLLALGAGLTGAAWMLIAGLGRPARPSLSTASALLLACAIVPVALEAADARAKATVVATGREVLLPLRPVDPRSLLQGDYMALRYHNALTGEMPESGGTVLLHLDEQAVARSARLADSPAAGNEVEVRLRAGRGAARLAPNSFLFEEGTADDWAKARFAMVRISGGDLVLTGLADEERRPIIPARRP